MLFKLVLLTIEQLNTINFMLGRMPIIILPCPYIILGPREHSEVLALHMTKTGLSLGISYSH